MTLYTYDLAPDIRVLGTEDSHLNMGILGLPGYSLVLIDTLFPKILIPHIDTVYGYGSPQVILHNHCHLDHCVGDILFPDTEVLLFGSQNHMLKLEQQRFPSAAWHTDYRNMECGKIELCEMSVLVEPVGGHSFDCVLMYLEHQDVLFAGENVANAKNGGRCVPHLSQFGNIHTAIAALDRLESFQSHCLIPAHGEPVMGKGACKEVLADNRHYLERLLEELHNARVSYWSTQQIESHRPSLDTVLLHTPDQYLPVSRAFHVKNWEYCCKEAQTKIERSK